MTVQINWEENRLSLRVAGDIYEEQAECLRDIVYNRVRRGIEELNIQLCASSYISMCGQRSLVGLCDSLGCSGVRVNFQVQGCCPSCSTSLNN